jgi:hypothetical protein
VLIFKITRNKRFLLSLIILGAPFVGWGVWNIFNVDNLVKNDLGLKDLTIPQRPLVLPYDHISYPTDQSSHLNYAHIFFNTTNEAFTAGDFIPYNMEIKVNKPNEVNFVGVVDYNVGTNSGLNTTTNMDYFLLTANKTGNLFQLEMSKDFSLYSKHGIYLFPVGQFQFLYIINAVQGWEIYRIEGTPLDIPAASQKDQLTTNRMILAQTIAQAKSNHMVEALTFIIIGLVPLGLVGEYFIGILVEEREKSRPKRSYASIH